MGVFHVFKILQMVPNRATYRILAVQERTPRRIHLWITSFLFREKQPFIDLYKIGTLENFANFSWKIFAKASI